MDVETRIRLIRMIEKIESNKEFSKHIGLKNVSTINSNLTLKSSYNMNRNRKEGKHYAKI